MKICYVCADLGISFSGKGGSSAHVRNIIRAWTLSGHEVVVVTHSGNAEADMGVPLVSVPACESFDVLSQDMQRLVDEEPSDDHYSGMRVIRALGHIWTNVPLEKSLRAVVSEFRPDFIYERYSPFSVAGVIIARQMDVPHILNVNAPLAWEGATYRKQALQAAAETLERIAFTFGSRIVTTCRELKADLVAAGVDPQNIAIMPMGVDVELFTQHGPASCESVDGRVVIGFVGSLKPWHGIETLVEAFQRLADDPRFHLMIVGDGPMAESIQELQEKLPGRVTHAGAVPQSDVPSYLRAMDIAVAPYPQLERFYYSPLKVLEYMATGRAVVASRIGQIVEMIRDGESGILVTPGDPDELVRAIQMLGSDRGLRRKVGAKASEEVRLHHTWMHRARGIVSFACTSGLIPSPEGVPDGVQRL